jgi:hypothetical protein
MCRRSGRRIRRRDARRGTQAKTTPSSINASEGANVSALKWHRCVSASSIQKAPLRINSGTKWFSSPAERPCALTITICAFTSRSFRTTGGRRGKDRGTERCVCGAYSLTVHRTWLPSAVSEPIPSTGDWSWRASSSPY